eukprot:gene10559-biopygen7447
MSLMAWQVAYLVGHSKRSNRGFMTTLRAQFVTVFMGDELQVGALAALWLLACLASTLWSYLLLWQLSPGDTTWTRGLVRSRDRGSRTIVDPIGYRVGWRGIV